MLVMNYESHTKTPNLLHTHSRTVKYLVRKKNEDTGGFVPQQSLTPELQSPIQMSILMFQVFAIPVTYY